MTNFRFDSQDLNMDRLNRRTQGNTNNAAKNVRQDFMNYSSNEGKFFGNLILFTNIYLFNSLFFIVLK